MRLSRVLGAAAIALTMEGPGIAAMLGSALSSWLQARRDKTRLHVLRDDASVEFESRAGGDFRRLLESVLSRR